MGPSGTPPSPGPHLPLSVRGVSAHRGGTTTRPENTLAAFREAVRLGVHQIELDVRRTADGAVVVLHDDTVDRTTNGKGRLSELRLAEVRALDAGGHSDLRHGGERVPTLAESLAAIPRDVWVNVQIKPNEDVVSSVVELVRESDRLHQVFLACGNRVGRRAREIEPRVKLCNLVRQSSRKRYVDHCVAEHSDFIQFHHARGPLESELVAIGELGNGSLGDDRGRRGR
jgi:glycerophosphoryl diester phosphodiesterase